MFLSAECLFSRRQLEALVRISESLAKMRLAPFANETDVDEALRLFHVSTLSSAGSGKLAGTKSSLSPSLSHTPVEQDKRCVRERGGE